MGSIKVSTQDPCPVSLLEILTGTTMVKESFSILGSSVAAISLGFFYYDITIRNHLQQYVHDGPKGVRACFRALGFLF